MHDFFAKMMRLAASKAAAFCYAVAVAVAGNLAFNFVQQHHQTPIAAPVPEASSPVGENAIVRPPAKAPTLTAAPAPAPQVSASPARIQVSLPLSPTVKPPPTKPPPEPVASAPILPAPAALPDSDSLPAPALRPAATPREAGLPTAPPPAQEEEAQPLPPLGTAIAVSVPPLPPAPPEVAAPSAADSTTLAALPPAASQTGPVESKSLALSDLWHPSRAVARGLHWAGAQLPILGDDAKADMRPARPVRAAPISLLPSDDTPPAGTETAKRAPGKPGPGSGGLY